MAILTSKMLFAFILLGSVYLMNGGSLALRRPTLTCKKGQRQQGGSVVSPKLHVLSRGAGSLPTQLQGDRNLPLA